MAAAVLWGMSYAASGRVMERGMTPLSFFFFYTLFGAVTAGWALAWTGRIGNLFGEIRLLGPEWGWFILALISSAAGSLLIYLAIGEKNATLASLIEISYPLFVAVFAWLFFREAQFNGPTILGGILILVGVTIVFLGNPE